MSVGVNENYHKKLLQNNSLFSDFAIIRGCSFSKVPAKIANSLNRKFLLLSPQEAFTQFFFVSFEHINLILIFVS